MLADRQVMDRRTWKVKKPMLRTPGMEMSEWSGAAASCPGAELLRGPCAGPPRTRLMEGGGGVDAVCPKPLQGTPQTVRASVLPSLLSLVEKPQNLAIEASPS